MGVSNELIISKETKIKSKKTIPTECDEAWIIRDENYEAWNLKKKKISKQSEEAKAKTKKKIKTIIQDYLINPNPDDVE